MALTVLEAAFEQRISAQSGFVFHSDRGSQYAHADYRSALNFAGVMVNVPLTVLFGNRLPSQRRPQNNVKQ